MPNFILLNWLIIQHQNAKFVRVLYNICPPNPLENSCQVLMGLFEMVAREHNKGYNLGLFTSKNSS